MEDKEERQKRLLIKEYDLVCDLTDCECCEEKDWCSEKDGMTRQEAIERMAKAICASNMAPDCLWECETCDRWKGSDKKAAEAALNALLDEQK